MSNYIVVGSYQTERGTVRNVKVHGESLYHCVKRIAESDRSFGIDNHSTNLRGGYIVADYDVSDKADIIARFI
tara:strand:- start:4046 stop:4264 length:219 start_codon:yes stop_codon:yes gene_type:complete